MSRICFIGGGNMTQAIIGGVLANGGDATVLSVVEPNAAARAKLETLGVACRPAWADAHDSYDLILLAVKPQMMQEAIAPMRGVLGDALVLSIAAGIRTDSLSRWLGNVQRIVRAMPNTPALIGAGITALYATVGVGDADRMRAESLLGAVGSTIWVDQESKLDAVTAVSGSGPAYVFYFIEALESAAIDLGLSPDVARKLAIETFRGGALLAASSAESPSTLRANVTSKRGTTERALLHFEQEALASRMIAGVRAAAARAAELGVEMDTTAASASSLGAR